MPAYWIQIAHHSVDQRFMIARTTWHHPGRVEYKCNDQTRTTAPLVCMPLFRLFSVKLFFDFELATPNIVGVGSTACNHGQVSRGCMIMQSTTCHSTIRSESLFPINRLRRYRPSTSCGSVCVLLSPLIFALTSGTYSDHRAAAIDGPLVKRLHRRSVESDG